MPTMTVAPEALLILNPRTDLRFGEFARESQDPDNNRASLERRIRRRYPLTIVRARDWAPGQAMVWYVAGVERAPGRPVMHGWWVTGSSHDLGTVPLCRDRWRPGPCGCAGWALLA